MERDLKNTMVKQGLIIAYYFSNRWYRKCLSDDFQVPDHHHADPVKLTESNEGSHSCRQKKTVHNHQVGRDARNGNVAKHTEMPSKKER